MIPTYNGFERLKATIRSVLDQHHRAHEVIVVDDGSTDQTLEIACMFGNDIQYVRVANGGQQRARNIGVGYSTGNWLALLDHDDLWEPGYLAEVTALVRERDVDVTMCNSRTRVDGPGANIWKDNNRFTQFAPSGYWEQVGATTTERWSVLERYDYASYLRFHPSQTSMVTLSRELYTRIHGFDERMRGNGAENLEFEIRLLRVARVGLIWQPLVTMVRHNANASLDGHRMSMDVVDCLNFALKHHGLDTGQRAAISEELPRRLLDAIDGAFAIGQLEAVRRYARQYPSSLSGKPWLKSVIARMPQPAGRLVARVSQLDVRRGWRASLPGVPKESLLDPL